MVKEIDLIQLLISVGLTSALSESDLRHIQKNKELTYEQYEKIVKKDASKATLFFMICIHAGYISEETFERLRDYSSTESRQMIYSLLEECQKEIDRKKEAQ